MFPRCLQRPAAASLPRAVSATPILPGRPASSSSSASGDPTLGPASPFGRPDDRGGATASSPAPGYGLRAEGGIEVGAHFPLYIRHTSVFTEIVFFPEEGMNSGRSGSGIGSSSTCPPVSYIETGYWSCRSNRKPIKPVQSNRR